MASFAPINVAGAALSGLPKAGGLVKPTAPPKPPSIGKAGTGLLNATLPKPTKPTKLVAGTGAAGSALAGGATQNLTQATAASAPAAAVGGGPGPSPSDLDSTYYQNVNNYLFNTGNKINADQLKSAADQTALQSALGQLAYAQPRAELALEQKANQTGGLFSSVYGQNLGNLNQKYLTEQNADTTKYNGDIQSLANAIAALQGGIPAYESDQAAASAQRAATAAQKNPSLGGTVPAAAAPSTSTAAPTAASLKAGGINPGVTKAGSSILGGLAQQLSKAKPAPKATKSTKNLGAFANLLK